MATIATMTSTNSKRLIVVVGPTGSGKTALAIALARHYGAPVISTDSRQVYRGMPIGTAQPTADELSLATHYFIADREPEDDFNCGRYEVEALSLLERLFVDNDYVVAVGGSGLYVKALCEGMDELPETSAELREKLKQRLATDGIESLFNELQQLDPVYAEVVDRHNPARVMRALEVCLASGRPYSEQRRGERAQRPFHIIKVGTDMPRDILYERINRRVDMMVADGLVEEVRALIPKRHLNALQTVGYRELFDYFDGHSTLEEAIDLIKRNSRRYAKRQLTWFRRDDDTAWFAPSDVESIIDHIDKCE
ncbi:MAG: tRNA (adenosine(37)-N6)-dimethylallyltransferase MiaA [Alistipes sp.]|nr:tRNA (adenosine(37)-N6)-dimethylallyltransferase MiaA [Alistipes sp.]MBR6661606.1 tRNA (adenosine(37)-N6)-dimethylallyltransferase MiaA [Alistipes sp.]